MPPEPARAQLQQDGYRPECREFRTVLHAAIDLRALCGANSVTLPTKFDGNRPYNQTLALLLHTPMQFFLEFLVGWGFGFGD